MRIKDSQLFDELNEQLVEFSKDQYILQGIRTARIRNVFVNQLIDSIRRVKYVFSISQGDISESRADPTSNNFDPLKASNLFKRQHMMDEAFWLIFLYVHIGKNHNSGWRLLQDIYGRLGSTNHWTWDRVSNNLSDFKSWLEDNYKILIDGKIHRGFGNHRKYETLNPTSSKSLAYVIESYVNWIAPPRTHMQFIQEMSDNYGDDPRVLFNNLYNSMNCVMRFGRLAKFDYLTMLSKLELAAIEPGRIFIKNSTGPMSGAKLLIWNNSNKKIRTSDLEGQLATLEDSLSLGRLGMQVLEDALCNWQKSPRTYKYFGG